MAETHQQFMQRCFQLAALGLGKVAPNPLVGAVLVYNNTIIGEGYHQKYGQAHAEVNAIASVKDKILLKHATLYVNLEPCSHFGKTPPCADLIIQHKVPQVVICNKDPNPLVAGKGIAKLEAVGIQVITDVLAQEGWHLNRRFFTFHTQKKPYIILKWAQSNDGFITKANDKQYWITGDTAKKLSHQWRSEEQAILVGTKTVLTDNPQLNNRYFNTNQQPVRVVVDRNLIIPESSFVLDNSQKTIVFNAVKNLQTENTSYIKINFENSIHEMLSALYERNILSLIVEGGAKTLNAFIQQNAWHEARILTGNIAFNQGIAAPTVSGKIIYETTVGNDHLTIISNEKTS
jgi:diaminohydroxyphosphoribosylaminopyrimidine deaminase/5-amino-6-(5-phosphoribosylamino)uracil reductase